MKIKISLLALILLSFLQTKAQDKSPSTLYSLLINGNKYVIEEGKDLKINETFVNPIVTIKSEPFQLFDNGNISFLYPKYFSREEEGGIGYKTWTLDGNDFNIMLFNFEGNVEIEQFVEIIYKKFGKKNCTRSQIITRIGKEDLTGIRLRISIAKIFIHQDFYKLPSNEKFTSFLVFQNTEKEGVIQTEEEKETMKAFNESVKY
jgi:hypothetical protein